MFDFLFITQDTKTAEVELEILSFPDFSSAKDHYNEHFLCQKNKHTFLCRFTKLISSIG